MENKALALVTGGAKRIGRAIVEDLAANGFTVVIHAHHSIRDAETLAGALRQRGADAHAMEADLTDMQAVTGLVARTAEAFGPVELLVNNASVFEHDEIGDLDEDLWDRHFAVHAKAPAFLAQTMASALPDDREGLVVNMIDQRVWRLTPRFFSYTLSKSALWTATQTMAQALAPRIRVNAIGLGPTLRSPRQSEADFVRQSKAVPLGRGPTTNEIGATIRYFWSNRSVTGQMIALDGGQHLAWETPDVAGITE
ncbi:SDR family oxidoreductase [Oricola thermophila]|uniref:SDR family oxidoreductase n=1 Tax=Oricola thermophila TaxID=2742145 RepID=A0A6N1VFM5_9HYPH|nr:SDR family oxidoreductase [Oricola thermophila]QKV18405.1 SDR family oxidoreductase [Oricola thermophila]